MKDPRNLDAWIQFAFVQSNLNQAINVLKFAEQQGQCTIHFILTATNTTLAPIQVANTSRKTSGHGASLTQVQKTVDALNNSGLSWRPVRT